METPTVKDVVAAKDLVGKYLPATPLWSYPALNEATGVTLYVKHENVQPVGSFKVRGGLAFLSTLSPDERSRGLITYSTGNHAQSIAYACGVFEVSCTIVMPANVSVEKIRGVESLGATVVLHGENMKDAQAKAEEIAHQQELILVSPGDTPALIAGVGTTYMEIFQAEPALDAVIVPIGSGTGAAAAGLVSAEFAPETRIVGVQSSAAPAAHDSWHGGECVNRSIETVVEGLATGRGFTLPQALMRDSLADFHLVTDEQIAEAQKMLATHAHTLAEGAGAASLAAVLAHPDVFAGQRVCIVCTGGNASAKEIAALSA